MKRFILPIFLILFGIINAQQRNLNYFLEKAKFQSPIIQKNKNENKLLELDLKQTERILRNPEINLESNILFAPIISHDNNTNRFQLVTSGSENYTGYDLANTDGGQFQAFVTVKQPLFKVSSYRNYSTKADILRKINQNATALTAHELEQLVGYQYILCLKAKVQIENSHILLRQLEEQLSIMQKLVEHAIYKQTDLMLLQIEYQNYEFEYKTAQGEYKNNLYDLNLLCGIKDTNVVDVASTNLELKSEINESSQFLNSYRLDSLNIETEQSIKELKYKPQLSLFANAGLNAIYLPSFNRFGFSTGLTFSWNIYDGGQRKIEHEKSIVSMQTLQFEKNYFVTQNEINLNKIRNQITTLNERTSLIEKQLSQYDKLYNVYQKEFSQGMISVMDFKTLLKDIRIKKQENVLIIMEKQVLINSYNYWKY